MRRLSAIFLRDVQANMTYRLGFILQFAAPLLSVAMFYFVGRLLKTAAIPGLGRYGGDYFSFALVGIVFSTFTSFALSTVASTVRGAQASGTLEVVLTTRTSIGAFLAGSSIYGIARSVVFLGVLLVFGSAVLGADLSGGNALAGAVILMLSVAVMFAIGLVSGTFVLLFKSDPFTTLILSSSFVLSGVAYPVEVLPAWLRWASFALPHTYALEGLRLTLLQDASFSIVRPQIGALMIFASVLLPLSLVAFNLAVRRARAEGSFGQF